MTDTMDRITLKTALDTDPWMAVYCVEPDREISVDMRYKDLVAIRKLIVRYCEEQRGKKKMSDLIDRKEAVEAIKNEMLSWLEGDSHDYRNVVDAIMDLPTVDAEPVIRCKDCAHKKKCQWYFYADDDNGFCKWAEREEHEID